MTQIRLLARCQMHGEVREPGYTFDMPEFKTAEEASAYLRSLPHTIVDHGNPHAANYRADLHGTSVDAVTGGAYVGPVQQPLRDVPLFEVIDGAQPDPEIPVPIMPARPSMILAPTPLSEQQAAGIAISHQEPVEEKPAEEAASAEGGPAAEGEAHDDESGDAPQV